MGEDFISQPEIPNRIRANDQQGPTEDDLYGHGTPDDLIEISSFHGVVLGSVRGMLYLSFSTFSISCTSGYLDDANI